MSRRIGFLFPVGDMQGYINLKGYGKFEASNRPSGWKADVRDLSDGSDQHRGADTPHRDELRSTIPRLDRYHALKANTLDCGTVLRVEDRSTINPSG